LSAQSCLFLLSGQPLRFLLLSALSGFHS
jgi:hypothetical protein